MNMRDLIPWSRGSGGAPVGGANQVPSVFGNDGESPFLALHREMNRLFDDAFRTFDAPTLFGRMPSWPSLEVSETDNEVRVAAELPGMEEKDVEVLLEDGGLTIRGEKRAEHEDKDRHFSERFYGRFERRIPLGFEAEEDKVSAAFKNGVLTVTVPKSPEAQRRTKRIRIANGH
jgi:HSP20 family protein